jgi:hypothetical protein
MPGRSQATLTALHKTVLICLLLAPFATATDHWDYQETHTDAHDFVAGGMLHVRLSVGGLHIRRSDTNQIHLRYTVKSRRESSVKEARVDFDVHGTDASLEFHAHGSNTAFDVELEVPQNTNLDIHQKVGDITVEEIEGNKDLSLNVGDIRVGKGEHGYRHVEASAGIGDVNGDGYGETSGWLGKTLKYHGEGKYELHAHVSVGDITLEGK